MYTKHDWQDGELITKSLMNNMEKGIEDANNRAMTPGPQGENGQSAYELWKSQEGNSDKTEDDFLNSLKGEKGEKGDAGQQGPKGDKGEQGVAGAKGDKEIRVKKAIQESRALPAMMAQLVLKVIQVQKLHLSRLMLTVQQLPAQHI